ncbi:Oligoribonuclease [Candidatus Providencia siddallii]|uniref:Oligoribonuclease n=2 Tax=Candidatus Providencia siddallii TaxID=1715285 RepID=A0ABM9NPU4_9GAMM
MKKNNNLIWIDLEMTGLHPIRNRIIEIATIITDKNINILAKGPVIPIYQTEKQLNLMDKWNITTHVTHGLIERVRKSSFNERDAELITINFLKQWVKKGSSPICGNTIGLDRQFLFNYMPELENFFHYRYIDVSTIKELALRWKPSILNKFTKKNTHQASNDIIESINELLFYKKYFFK